MGGVLDLSAVFAAIAHCRGHGELRQRGCVYETGATGVRKRSALAGRGNGCITCGGIYQVQDLVKKLGYATNETARRYLSGEIDAKAAASWLQKYALMDEKRTDQAI